MGDKNESFPQESLRNTVEKKDAIQMHTHALGPTDFSPCEEKNRGGAFKDQGPVGKISLNLTEGPCFLQFYG